jgi:integrase
MKKIRRGLWFDGKRWARLEVTLPGTRKRRKKRVACTSRAEAEHLHAQFRNEVLNPKAPTSTLATETLSSYVRRCFPISRDAAQPISPRTEAAEWNSLSKVILPEIGQVRLTDITDVVVEDLRAIFKKRGHRNATVNNRIRLLHKCLVHAQRRGKHLDPPLIVPALSDWPAKLPEEELHQELTPDEIVKYIGAFDTGVIGGGAGGAAASRYYTQLFRWAKPLYVAALHLGLARADLLNLRWSNVNFATGLITVERQKTGVPCVIPMSQILRKALTLSRRRSVVSSDYCFTTPSGSRYSEMTFRRYHLQALKLAGITRRVRPHDLRHSFGSLLVSRNISLEKVARAMGHRSARTTKRYARVSAESMSPIGEALDGME